MPERDDDLAAATVEALAATARAASELAQAQAETTGAVRELRPIATRTEEAAQYAWTYSAGAKSHAQAAAAGIAQVGAEVARLHAKVRTPARVPAVRRIPWGSIVAAMFLLAFGVVCGLVLCDLLRACNAPAPTKAGNTGQRDEEPLDEAEARNTPDMGRKRREPTPPERPPDPDANHDRRAPQKPGAFYRVECTGAPNEPAECQTTHEGRKVRRDPILLQR